MRSIWMRRAGLLLVLIVVSGFGGLARDFAPDAVPWPRWEAHDPQSTTSIDHGPWDIWLSRYVEDAKEPNLVAYGAVDAEGRALLDGYIEGLSQVDVSGLTRDEQFAYWVNLYNALTVQVVLDHYPVESIKDIDISPGLFSSGPWDKELVTVEGIALSLNDIEHRILRPVWNDPRIHYAVNCAALGCPDLQARAFTAERLETMLDQAARSYVNDRRGVLVEGEAIIVSSIYDWFHEDFGGTDRALLTHLARYADENLRARLEAKPSITEARYDWALNAKQ